MPTPPVSMHAEVTEIITSGILERLHVVYARPEDFDFRDFAYLEIFSSFYSFKLPGLYCIFKDR